jgi:N-acyl-L-homoserine lactone synthetase
LNEEFSVEIAGSPDQTREAYRLRYQTYCVERGYEASSTGLEIDEFDDRSHHVILRHRRSGAPVGTVRLVLADPDAPLNSFPLQRLCDPRHLQTLPIGSTAEISRFAVPKRSRAIGSSSAALVRLGLMRGLLKMSRELQLTHWCAVMERSLLRLLRSTAIYFDPMGPMVEHHGLRQPTWAAIDRILAQMRREQGAVWSFVTDGGRLGLAEAV